MDMILEALVGAFTQNLAELVTEKVASVLGIEDDIERLRQRMTFVESCIADAERRSLADSAVINWLNALRDFVCDAEDVIDSCRSEGGKLLLENKPSSSSSSSSNQGVSNNLSVVSWFTNIRSRYRIRTQISKLHERLDDICNYDNLVSSLENIRPNEQLNTVNWRQTCSLVEPDLVGKDINNATKELVRVILVAREPNIHVVSVVGMGGIGKTTLGQKVYNDPKIKDKFQKRIWVCVSQDYSEVNLLKQIIRAFNNDLKLGETIGELQCTLADIVNGQSFFLVLDDVWWSDLWSNLLRIPLHGGASGMILVTTRDRNVALKFHSTYIHQVKEMSKFESWELLRKSANVKTEEARDLENIGNQIVSKCGRLPLAIKAIGGLLSTRAKNNNEWESVLNSDAWSMSTIPQELGALYLSYQNLRSHLKQCFLLCSLYPEDTVIYREDIIRLWVAAGIIEPDKNRLLEDIAEEYYYNLLCRSFLLPIGDVVHHKCKMHDLFRSLGQHLSKGQYFFGNPQFLDITTLSKLRYLSISSKEEMIRILDTKVELRLRALLLFSGQLKVNDALLCRLPYLRILHMNLSGIKGVPESIGELIHLRMLDLNYTSISSLPESIGFLKKLLILNLCNCKLLNALPRGVIELCNLRRLALYGSPLNSVPKEIGSIPFLNYLTGFVLAGDITNDEMQDGWHLEELESLSQLRELHLCKLHRVVLRNDALVLVSKYHLRYLWLDCRSQAEQQTEEQITMIEKVFEKLSPPPYLNELYIYEFCGRRCPTWMETPNSLHHVVELYLVQCRSWQYFPPLGHLPNLKILIIKGALRIVTIGCEFAGNGARGGEGIFPKLEVLLIEKMPNWEDWSFITAQEDNTDSSANEITTIGLPMLPCLKKLNIIDCPKLKALPEQLNQATNLQRLLIQGAHCLTVVENLTSLSDVLQIENCTRIERVLNFPEARLLNIFGCPALSCVENFHELQELTVTDDLLASSPPWLSALINTQKLLHGDCFEIYSIAGEHFR